MCTKDSNTNQHTLEPKGKILKIKIGYNPNSSSIGTMIFAVPAAMLGVAVGFGAVSGMIFSSLCKKKSEDISTDIKEPLGGVGEAEGIPHSK